MREAFFGSEKKHTCPQELVDFFLKNARYYPSWDRDFFEEAYQKLDSQFFEADAKKKRSILMDRYFDVTDPYEASGSSSFFQDQFVIPPPRLSVEQCGASVKHGGVVEIAYPEGARHTMILPIEIFQYGPSRIYHVPPGSWTEVRGLGEQDVIGTTALTSCTAIVAATPTRHFMAHVLSSRHDDIRAILQKCQDVYKGSNMAMISPFWREQDGTENDRWNCELSDIAKEQKVALHQFPYIGHKTSNPDEIDWTTVILGKDFFRSLGTRCAGPRNPFRSGSYLQPRYKTIVVERTVCDRSFSTKS